MARTLAGAGPERTNRLILIGAIALAVVAAVLVFAGLSGTGVSGGSSVAGTVSVVVASQDLKAGTKITSDMLAVQAVPSRAMVQGALTDKAAAVGLTALYPLQKNDQLSAAKLGQGSKDGGFTGVIPTGKRAVAIPVSETTSVGGLIVAGDHIDITAVLGSGNNAQTASTLLQDVLVLSVGQTSAKAVARLDANGNPLPEDSQVVAPPDNTDPNAKAKTITVAVNPQDVAVLALAQDQGKIYLSLRPPGDEAAVPGVDAPQTLPAPQTAPAP